jgi:hypothetical protein
VGTANLIAVLIMTVELTSTLKDAKITKHLTDAKRFAYASYIAEASVAHGVDPYLVAAVIYTESRFTNLRVNKTRDYGLMQVHWQRGWKAPWLKGLKRKDLYDPRTNIAAGTHELAYVRAFCKKRGHGRWVKGGVARRHNWWAHYLFGVVVKKRWYDMRIERVRSYLHRAAARVRARNKV